MGRSTKPVRLKQEDAERLQELADETGLRPAELFTEMRNVAEPRLDFDQMRPVGRCPVCGHEFQKSDTSGGYLSEETVRCPEAEPHSEDDDHDCELIAVTDLDEPEPSDD